ncbi:hypothetical protein D3C81_1341950 [compost metagenome]
MTAEAINRLYAKLDEPMRKDNGGTGGCGLWNVQQRLKHFFGEASGLLIAPSPAGGLQITLRMEKKEVHDASNSSG